MSKSGVTVYFDSNTFLTWLKEEDKLKTDSVGALLSKAKEGKLHIVTSSFTSTEILFLKKKVRVPVEDRKKIRDLLGLECITVVSLTQAISEEAQEIFWETGIQNLDCIHAATARVWEIGTIYTYDKRFLNNSPIQASRDYGEVKIVEPPSFQQYGMIP